MYVRISREAFYFFPVKKGFVCAKNPGKCEMIFALVQIVYSKCK